MAIAFSAFALTERGMNSVAGQCVDQGGVNGFVEHKMLYGQAIARRRRNAVSYFTVVQYRASASGAAHRGAIPAGFVLPPIVILLEVSQRESGLLPTIESQRKSAPGSRRFQQRFIHRHVPSARSRRIDE